jgi:hypothetical protein
MEWSEYGKKMKKRVISTRCSESNREKDANGENGENMEQKNEKERNKYHSC